MPRLDATTQCRWRSELLHMFAVFAAVAAEMAFLVKSMHDSRELARRQAPHLFKRCRRDADSVEDGSSIAICLFRTGFLFDVPIVQDAECVVSPPLLVQRIEFVIIGNAPLLGLRNRLFQPV